MGVNILLTELLARMPELEWQLNKLGSSFSPKALPKGLFRQEYDAPTASYVTEIKTDISTLAAHTNDRVVRYLALKINQKINVLVTACSHHNRKKTVQETVSFGVDSLSTRSQWLQTLELNIRTLTAQKEALSKTLTQRGVLSDSVVQLNLQRELGELEKRLTLAHETYTRATS